MNSLKDKFSKVGMIIPNILMPCKDVDLKKWAVVACDQYTSEPEYWSSVAEEVGASPSTLNLIFPEVYLEDEDKDQRIERINAAMEDYLKRGILEDQGQAFFLVQRNTPDSPTRWGLMAALDLEEYDFSKDSSSLIRATEGTILDRIPPRKQIRKNASIELPHIMVLIDDPEATVIEPLAKNADSLEKIYDFDLMKNGGHITGYRVDGTEELERIADALQKLADPSVFSKKYGADKVLLFAMGDGNHSLATAKSVWEDIKASGSDDPDIMQHPARWALVEIENIYDEGLIFEPIHRVLFNSDFASFSGELEKLGSVEFTSLSSTDEVMKRVASADDQHIIGYVDAERTGVFTVKDPDATIAAGTTQTAIDNLVQQEKTSVDYIHGQQSTENLGRKAGNIGIFLPALDKSDFFRTVIHDGALPRKTFSMGEAHEKRYYIEARKIKAE
ncbi:MAG: DUF1015 domain-containing protein [Spirochaetota bacterium]